LLTVAVSAGLFLRGGSRPVERPAREVAFIPLVVTAAVSEVSPWEMAAQKVAEERGEPVGKQAEIEVPRELRHYSDARRFLALQVAEWRKHKFQTPQDYAGLAGLIRERELVEVQSVTDSYILYGVGGLATGEPFTFFDRARGQSVALYDGAGLEREYERMKAAADGLKGDLAALRKELGSLPKRERARGEEERGLSIARHLVEGHGGTVEAERVLDCAASPG
jgi:hypothetical protein